MKHLLFLFFYLVVCINIYANGDKTRITRQEYISKYKNIAIEEMNRTGIPASITLAQGILESSNGNSKLAVEAKNHFGIKCHNWLGPYIRIDDDEENECFRKYKDALQSYKDHSEFLTTRNRYSFLFDIPAGKYKAWAHGLKKAGYATNPKYGHLLIKIIEAEKLYLYDSYTTAKPDEEIINEQEDIVDLSDKLVDIDDEFIIDPFGARLEEVNGQHFIVVKKGDTFYSIEKNLGVTKSRLLRYNELEKNYILMPGEILFLHRKKGRAKKGVRFHRVKEGEDLHFIAQKYCVRLKKICKFNGVKSSYKLIEGERIWLRPKGR